jgi:hypothetical protein
VRAVSLAAAALLLSALLLAAPANAQEAAPAVGKPPEPAAAPSTQAGAELKERASGFYNFLRGKQVNIYSLFQNETFRDYFTAEDVLQNYIAYLTSRLGDKRFRKYRVENAEVLSVKPSGPDRAKVRVKLVGRHRQAFFFWDNATTLEDDWRRVEGDWYVFPPPF